MAISHVASLLAVASIPRMSLFFDLSTMGYFFVALKKFETVVLFVIDFFISKVTDAHYGINIHSSIMPPLKQICVKGSCKLLYAGNSKLFVKMSCYFPCDV